jgi:hypothetical protein
VENNQNKSVFIHSLPKKINSFKGDLSWRGNYIAQILENLPDYEKSIFPIYIEPTRDIETYESRLKVGERDNLISLLVEKNMRDDNLWNFVFKANELTTLSCVPSEYVAELVHSKNLSSVFDTLIDDVVDDIKDRSLMEKLLLIPLGNSGADELLFSQRELFNFTESVWNNIIEVLKDAPRFNEFRYLWLFDVMELMQCFRFNYLQNIEPQLCNTEEYLVYSTHNHNVKVQFTQDLMFSPTFDKRELGAFRRGAQHIQIAMQLANDIQTLEREVKQEKCFTNYLIIWGIENKYIESEDIYEKNYDKIVSSLPMQKFEDMWDYHITQTKHLMKNIKSFDVDALMNNVIQLKDAYNQSNRLCPNS